MKYLRLIPILSMLLLLGCTAKESRRISADIPNTSVPPSSPARELTPSIPELTGESIQNRLVNLGIGVSEEGIESIDFELEDLTGKPKKLSSYRGKVVFLNFWATWCGPCRVEMPSMQRLYERFKKDGLEIVAVDLQEGRKQVQAFVNELELTFPVLLDIEGSVGQTYDARAIPTTYLIDREGLIFGKAVGAKEWDTPAMISVFSEIVGEGVEYKESSHADTGRNAASGEIVELTIEAYN